MRRIFQKPILFLFLVFAFFVKPLEASVVMKLIGINPSETRDRKVVLKAYLPEEIEPENVIDKVDMDLVYDTKEGMYYVFGEYTVPPGGNVEREVEIEDVWVIPAEEIENLRKETMKTAELLSRTEYRARALFLKESIESKLNQIERRQKIAAVNPQKHVSNYRENVALLEAVKTDVMFARSLMSQAKGVPHALVWKIFIWVVVFLGLLGLTFYFVWQKQMKSVDVPFEIDEPSPEELLASSPKKTTQEPKTMKSDDLKRMMDQE